MAIKLSENLTLEKDTHSWMLIEARGPQRSYNHKTYHSSLEQVARKLLMIESYDTANDVREMSLMFSAVLEKIEIHLKQATTEMPMNENKKPKDWVKLGLSPSTIVEEIDCRPINDIVDPENTSTIVVKKQYLKMIEKDSYILEILTASDDHDVQRIVEIATKEHEDNIEEIESYDYHIAGNK